jgi:glycosyltransferase 2 family protein
MSIIEWFLNYPFYRKELKTILKYFIPVGVGLALLFWVFKDIDLQNLLQSFQNANYLYVVLAGFVGLVAHTSRAYRWQLMLRPMGFKPSLANSTSAVLIGYITNLLLPRAGELARSASLQKTEGVPFEKSFGAVIAERVIDVLVLGLLVLLNLALEYDRINGLVKEVFGEKLNSSHSLLYAGGAFLMVIGLAIVLLRKFKTQLLNIAIFNKIWSKVEGLWAGFSSVLKLQQPGLFILHTFIIWGCYFLSTFLLCKAVPLGANLSLLAVLTILVMGSIGMAAPTMGGIGSFHFLVGKIVVLYSLTAQEGINLATFLHTMQGIVIVVVLGIAGFLYVLLTKKRA